MADAANRSESAHERMAGRDEAAFGSAIARVEVEHLPDRIATRARVTPASIAAFPEVERATFVDRAVVARIVAAADRSRPRPVADAGFDCRWVVRFFEAGRRDARTSLALDAFGRRGALAGRPIELDATPLLAALRAAHPAFARE